MKNRIVILAVLTLSSMPAFCFAEEFKPGPYVAAYLNVSIPDKADAKQQSSAGSAVTSDRMTLDASGGSSLVGGYDFGCLRLEGELGFKRFKVSSVSRSDGSNFDTDGNVNIFSTMVNGYLDYRNSTRLTPYIGGGIGFAALSIENTYGTNTQSGAVSKLYHSNDDIVFAYQAGAGLDIAINRHFSVDVGYRYFGTARTDFDKDYPKATGIKLNSHDVVAGLRYRF